jgi:hypothetical protein
MRAPETLARISSLAMLSEIACRFNGVLGRLHLHAADSA